MASFKDTYEDGKTKKVTRIVELMHCAGYGEDQISETMDTFLNLLELDAKSGQANLSTRFANLTRIQNWNLLTPEQSKEISGLFLALINETIQGGET